MPRRRATEDAARVPENEPTAEDVDRMFQERAIALKQGPAFSNIVATADIECQLDLKSVALHLRNAEYNPKRFPAVSIRIRDPKTTALIFKSGKMVVTGARSIDDSKLKLLNEEGVKFDAKGMLVDKGHFFNEFKL